MFDALEKLEELENQLARTKTLANSFEGVSEKAKDKIDRLRVCRDEIYEISNLVHTSKHEIFDFFWTCYEVVDKCGVKCSHHIEPDEFPGTRVFLRRTLVGVSIGTKPLKSSENFVEWSEIRDKHFFVVAKIWCSNLELHINEALEKLGQESHKNDKNLKLMIELLDEIKTKIASVIESNVFSPA